MNFTQDERLYLKGLDNLVMGIWVAHGEGRFVNNSSSIAIQYVDNSYCGPKNAISANFKIKVEKGFFIKYLDSREKIKCWVDDKSEKGIKIINGDAIRMN